jgi:hypothetical protein
MENAKTKDGVHVARCACCSRIIPQTHTRAERNSTSAHPGQRYHHAHINLAHPPCCRSTEANKYSQEELRLMRTQDAKYLQLKAQVIACCWAADLALLCAVVAGLAGDIPQHLHRRAAGSHLLRLSYRAEQ